MLTMMCVVAKEVNSLTLICPTLWYLIFAINLIKSHEHNMHMIC